MVGGAFVCALHMVGAVFADRPSREITGTALRVMTAGLLVSLITGGLLFMPRAQAAVANWIFGLKMLLLVAAVLSMLIVPRFAQQADFGSVLKLRAWGFVIAALWLAVGAAGAAFILLE